MRRGRPNSKPREKRTLIPPFDPEELARDLERATSETSPPPYDTSAYARIVQPGGTRAEPPSPDMTLTPTPPARPLDFREDTLNLDDVESVGREMYGCYLASEFPAALSLAERVLEKSPDHALAQLVADRCRDRLMPSRRSLSPSSVLRLRVQELERQAGLIDATSSFVLNHIDGISDAATVARLTGLPDPEALDRLHALLDLGVLEVVSL